MPDPSRRIAAIHQITTAQPGWSIENHGTDTERGGRPRHPVAVWALCEDHDGKRFVVGLVPDTYDIQGDADEPHPSVDIELYPPDEGFRRYVWEGE